MNFALELQLWLVNFYVNEHQRRWGGTGRGQLFSAKVDDLRRVKWLRILSNFVLKVDKCFQMFCTTTVFTQLNCPRMYWNICLTIALPWFSAPWVFDYVVAYDCMTRYEGAKWRDWDRLGSEEAGVCWRWEKTETLMLSCSLMNMLSPGLSFSFL